MNTCRTELLNMARKERNDEFYTCYDMIEYECKKHKEQYKDKIIYCNCDTEESNFYKYFVANFNDFKIKKVIATCYVENGRGVKVEYDGTTTRNLLNGDGDFRSTECMKILECSDIVITNPPFSLCREYYIPQLIQSGKKFLVLASNLLPGYKNIFPYFKEYKIKISNLKRYSTRYFLPQTAKTYTKIDEKGVKVKEVAADWYTNLDIQEKPFYKLTKTYNAKDYPKYYNCNAINVNKSNDIPKDYYGVMGVPISFLPKLNKKQFKIIGLGKFPHFVSTRPNIKGGTYLALKVDTPPKNKSYHTAQNGDIYITPFTRLLIQRI